MDIVKIAIVSGRAQYSEWGLKANGKDPVYCDIEHAYKNIDTFTKTLSCLGFTDITQLVDPTHDEMKNAFD